MIATARIAHSQARRRRRPGTVALAVAILGALPNQPARAEMLRVDDMLRGIDMTPAQCATTPNAVWVTAMGTSVCMRYYISTAGGKGANPVVFMQGDKFGPYDKATDTFARAAEFHDVDTRELQKIADAYSIATHTTGIDLARVGIDGSSGYHGIRHTELELNLTDAALDAIKQRYRFTGFNLTGQSGGSSLVGGLLGLRTDILCAVPGSGRLAFPPGNKRRVQPLDQFNPIEDIQKIVRNGSRRILVLTDPQDQKVPAVNQTPFVEALRQAGGRIEQFFVRATGPEHHVVHDYTYPAMAGCMYGASHNEIANALGDVQLRLFANEMRSPMPPLARSF